MTEPLHIPPIAIIAEDEDLGRILLAESVKGRRPGASGV